ncbi:hypothetical protein [Streptomyces sp. NPDC047706]|uniref:hypothetical protein n=1 Tax=Streptomyces sp. NPDC047706 TaxID=3365486 RepID=UPI0037195788
MAAALRVRRATLSGWEAGRTEPRPPEREAYARLLRQLAEIYPADPDATAPQQETAPARQTSADPDATAPQQDTATTTPSRDSAPAKHASADPAPAPALAQAGTRPGEGGTLVASHGYEEVRRRHGGPGRGREAAAGGVPEGHGRPPGPGDGDRPGRGQVHGQGRHRHAA